MHCCSGCCLFGQWSVPEIKERDLGPYCSPLTQFRSRCSILHPRYRYSVICLPNRRLLLSIHPSFTVLWARWVLPSSYFHFMRVQNHLLTWKWSQSSHACGASRLKLRTHWSHRPDPSTCHGSFLLDLELSSWQVPAWQVAVLTQSFSCPTVCGSAITDRYLAPSCAADRYLSLLLPLYFIILIFVVTFYPYQLD